MVVVLLLVLAALGLGAGWLLEIAALVWAALVLSAVAAGVVLFEHVRPAPDREAEDPGSDEPGGDSIESGVGAESVATDVGPARLDNGSDGLIEAEGGASPAVEEAAVVDPDIEADDADEVVFLPRRATFHAPGCPVVVDRPVARGRREDLVASGMSACRRCLPA